MQGQTVLDQLSFTAITRLANAPPDTQIGIGRAVRGSIEDPRRIAQYGLHASVCGEARQNGLLKGGFGAHSRTRL
jgi:hypothetical protein